MSALHIQVKVVEFFVVVTIFIQTFNDSALSVIHNNKDMRQFDGGVSADFKTRGDAVVDNALGCAQGRVCGICVGIVFKVNCHHKTKSSTLLRVTLDKDETVTQRIEYVGVKIFLHCGVDFHCSLFTVFVFKIDFGEDEFQCAGGVTDKGLQLLPVLSL